MPIRRYVEEGAFTSEALSAMGKAFEDAIWTLGAERDEKKHEAVAKFIIQLARSEGNLDAATLHRRAVAEFGSSTVAAPQDELRHGQLPPPVSADDTAADVRQSAASLGSPGGWGIRVARTGRQDKAPRTTGRELRWSRRCSSGIRASLLTGVTAIGAAVQTRDPSMTSPSVCSAAIRLRRGRFPWRRAQKVRPCS
jgi:hypothetical protein